MKKIDLEGAGIVSIVIALIIWLNQNQTKAPIIVGSEITLSKLVPAVFLVTVVYFVRKK